MNPHQISAVQSAGNPPKNRKVSTGLKSKWHLMVLGGAAGLEETRLALGALFLNFDDLKRCPHDWAELIPFSLPTLLKPAGYVDASGFNYRRSGGFALDICSPSRKGCWHPC
ncbi:hypothetical protein NL676_024869 [Syzygium grande]|nr:hypothetical protein NL676_024869 [Syzygium grande]